MRCVLLWWQGRVWPSCHNIVCDSPSRTEIILYILAGAEAKMIESSTIIKFYLFCVTIGEQKDAWDKELYSTIAKIYFMWSHVWRSFFITLNKIQQTLYLHRMRRVCIPSVTGSFITGFLSLKGCTEDEEEIQRSILYIYAYI